MSNTTPSSTSRIARSLAPRHVLPVALLFLIADLALTDALLGLAVEKTRSQRGSSRSIGVTTTGVVAVGVVTLAYVGLDALDRYERERRVVSGGLLGVMIAPVVWNLGVWVRLGTPALRSGSRRDARDRDRLDGCGHRRDKVDLDRVPTQIATPWCRSCLSVLMVTSMVGGAAFVGTQSFSDSEAGGTVSAQEYNSQSLIFSVSSDDSLRAINSSMGSQVWRFDGHTSSLTTVAVTPDKSTVFSGGFDNTIKAVDTTSGEEIWSFNNHRDTVRSISVGDGSILYSVSDDGTVRGIDAGSGAQLWKYENGGRLISVEPLSSSNSVLYGTAGGTVKD